MKIFADSPSASQSHLQVLTADETDQVGGGFWGLLVLAVACAVLLEHD